MQKLKLITFLLLIPFLFEGCQDDPILQQVVDGVPVITPKSKAYITTIQLNQHPATDPFGNTWDAIDTINGDPDGLPDIFFNVTLPEPDPPVLWSQESHFANIQSTDTIPFFLLDHFEIVPFGMNIDLNIYDFELPDSTLMETLNFFIGEYPDPLNPYPAYITSEANGYSITLGLRYED